MNNDSTGNSNGDVFPNLNVYNPDNTYNGGYTVIGVCSLCGGDVVAYSGPWLGVNPPVPYCTSCGARERQNKGPVIPMEPAWPRRSRDEYWCIQPLEPLHLAIYKHDYENCGSSEIQRFIEEVEDTNTRY